VGRSNSQSSSAALIACLKQELALLRYWEHYSAILSCKRKSTLAKFERSAGQRFSRRSRV